MNEAIGECQLHKVTRGLMSFILDDLSRWYVQLVRPRLWLEEESEEKRYAYETMYYVMRQLVTLLAPFTPHITEQMYDNIRLRNDPASVHMLTWFTSNPSLIDAGIESRMSIVQSFDEAQANARQSGKRKLRWPVSECVIATDSPDIRAAIEQLNDLCCDRANAKRVRVVEGIYDRISWKAEPVMKALGPGFGKNAPKVKELILAADGNRVRETTLAGRTYTLVSGNDRFEIGSDHVTFVEGLPESVFSAPMQDATVYVDTALTPELEAEGNAREVIRRIQEMRRQLDLNVEDFIASYVVINDSRICELVSSQWKDGIMEEVRAKQLTMSANGSSAPGGDWDLEKDWDIEGLLVRIGISGLPDQ
jgi:isoleucyl-tRNA synthetase